MKHKLAIVIWEDAVGFDEDEFISRLILYNFTTKTIVRQELLSDDLSTWTETGLKFKTVEAVRKANGGKNATVLDYWTEEVK